ncbi:MAG: hypothetical protein JW829_06905 [Pirellulales bacterium]|nr:hypothetical protein [Pirellulales bacterium]
MNTYVIPSIRDRRQTNVINGITYKIGSNQEEREQSFQLIHDTYVANGLIEENALRMRVTQWHMLPTTDLFLAIHDSTVIYTMTLISDDRLGVPMDSIYPKELQILRETGVYFAEVSCIALERDYFSNIKMFNVFVQLVGLVFQYARYNDIQQLVIAIHARHSHFYKRFLGFEPISKVKPYKSDQDYPIVACSHDFKRLDMEGYRLFDRVYSNQFDRRYLLRQPMLSREREDLLSQVVEFDNRPIPADVA